MDCGYCGTPVAEDGKGELIHEDSGKYGCDPGRKGGFYPVAQ
jgi:hypothetical protein